jgi:hypothetical protein
MYASWMRIREQGLTERPIFIFLQGLHYQIIKAEKKSCSAPARVNKHRKTISRQKADSGIFGLLKLLHHWPGEARRVSPQINNRTI